MANGKDPELIQIFTEEATDLIASISKTLRDWEENLKDLNKIGDLKRDLHTLKGSARMVGILPIGNLAHEIESFCGLLEKNEIPVDRNAFLLVNLGQDRVSVMLEKVKNNQSLVEATDLIEKFQILSKMPGAAAKAAEKGKEDHKEKKKHAGIEQKKTEVKVSEHKAPTEAPQEAAPTSAPSHGGELIRVKINLLEKLTNLSAENSMIRVDLEQHLSTLGVYLSEIKQETKRLDVQLNTLNTEIYQHATQSVSRLLRDGAIKKSSKFKKSHKHGKYENTNMGDNLDSYLEEFSALEEIGHVIKETTFDIMSVLKNLSDVHLIMENLILNQGRVSTELQHRLSDTRLVPFESVVPRLSRIARQVTDELNKSVDFKVSKTEGEMDRTVLEQLIPSLEHILRNAIDHGIEPASVRKKAHKPEIGRVDISFNRTGSIVAIEVKDDGGGINVEAVKKKAIKLGLLAKEKENEITDEEAFRYILVPGFSTREAVTQISGRGVGMDVVNTAVTELGGNIVISSKPGEGTKFTIRFPFTASLNRLLVFSVHDQNYGMLLTSVEKVLRVSKEEVTELFKHKSPEYKDNDKKYDLFYLGSILEHKKSFKIPDRSTYPLILVTESDYSVAFLVDQILYSREFVVQSLGGQFKLLNECSGATFLADGSVVLIVDPYNLCLKAKTFMERKKVKVEFMQAKTKELMGKPLIMIVDDSVSVRAVTEKLLVKNNYSVISSKDGVDALQQLEHEIPQIILLDLDMPRMDGFEFAATIQQDERFKNIPIIVISSRTTEMYRKRAASLNLNAFIKKPYQESELVTTIQTLLEKPK